MSEDFTVRAVITVDGHQLDSQLEPLVESVYVQHDLARPGRFSIALLDPQRDVIQRAGLQFGSEVVISANPFGRDETFPLIKGEVVSLVGEYNLLGDRAWIEGYEFSHRLQRGVHTQSYRNVTDSDLARQIAERAEIQAGTIEESGTTHDHVSQVNVSDWEFLRMRAHEIGFEVSVVDGKLEFGRPVDSSAGPPEGTLLSAEPLQLVYGANLLRFQPRLSSAEQISEVEVRSWDPKQKMALIGIAPAGTTSARLSTDPAEMAARFGNPAFMSGDRPLADQTSVDATAAALADQIGGSFAEAEGTARGDPRLRAGSAVSVSGVAAQFAGRYTLSSTDHLIDGEGYRTELVVSGRQQRSLLSLASGGAANGDKAATTGRVYGLVVALVTANDDPEGLGRVKMKFPWLSDAYESDWARMVQLGAGPDSGAVFIPEVNDEVLVGFEFGDVRRPYVVGGLYNGQDKPRLGEGLFDRGKVKRRGFVSRRGHRVVLFDDDGTSGVAILTSDGKLRIALNETEGEIHIFGDSKVVVEAQRQLELSSAGDIKLEANGRLTLEANQGITIRSDGVVDVDGALIQLN